MSDLPKHPITDDDRGPGRDHSGVEQPSRVSTVVIAGLIVAALIVMLVLHVTGVLGPGDH